MKATKYQQQNNLVVTSNLKNSFDSRWSEVKITGKNIKGRSGHVALFFGNLMFLHGGYNTQDGILDDFYSIDLAEDKPQFEWQKLNNTLAEKTIKVKGHSGVVYKGQIIIFGGQVKTNQNTNEVLKYQIGLKQWKNVKTSGIANVPKLDSHCSCSNQQNWYIYGGYISEKATCMKDIYCLNLNTMQWKLLYQSSPQNQEPQARSYASMVFHEGSIWLLGGSNGIKTLNDMWKFDLSQNKWLKIECNNRPQPRRGHSMILFKNTIFLFGGIQQVTREKNDIYVYQFDKNSWSKIHTYTNSIYQCSPTLKRSKQTLSKSIDSFSIQRLSPVKSYQSGDDLMRKIMSENRHKKFLQKKKQMMKKFNQNYEQNKNKRRVSPTTQSMMKSLISIGDQQDNKNSLSKQIIYDQTGRYIVGKKPCARDGQSVVVCKDKMYICGGDRHLMSFNDLFIFDLEKGIKSLELYRSK